MFREMRRKRQALTEQETIQILERGTSGTLALLGDDGYPYAVPISYVYTDGKIFFHGAVTGHKIDAIRSCGKASFCVSDQDYVVAEEYTTYYRSAIVFGRIRIIEDDKQKRQAIEKLALRYSPEQKEKIPAEIDRGYPYLGMIELDIEHMSGKESKELAEKKRDAKA